jgi:hypothetical protein
MASGARPRAAQQIGRAGVERWALNQGPLEPARKRGAKNNQLNGLMLVTNVWRGLEDFRIPLTSNVFKLREAPGNAGRTRCVARSEVLTPMQSSWVWQVQVQ